jgi:hypothetical protein
MAISRRDVLASSVALACGVLPASADASPSEKSAAVACGKGPAGNRSAFARARGPLSLLGACMALFLPAVSEAGLYQRDQVPVRQFGFSSNGVPSSTDYLKLLNVARDVLGAGAVIRTGLSWDPTRRAAPNFETWSRTYLEPALVRGLAVLPGVRTINLDRGGLRMPTDAQWAAGLRQIVSMYGPGGIYQTGGSYIDGGRTVVVSPHPSFPGLTDYELWNEPNTQGNLNGAMTPTRVTQLLAIASSVMRANASRLGFQINIVGPAVGGTDLDYVKALWQADNQVFSYINTLSMHDYMRFPPSQCTADGLSRKHCIVSFGAIRSFLDQNGGAGVHLAATEGGYSGDRGTCLSPYVRTEEQQRDYSEAALNWLRARPELNFDFWLTFVPIDRVASYSYPCDSTKYDHTYWSSKLGVVRPDLTWKPWAIRYHDLYSQWRQ